MPDLSVLEPLEKIVQIIEDSLGGIISFVQKAIDFLSKKYGGCINLVFTKVCVSVSVMDILTVIGGLAKKIMDFIGVTWLIDNTVGAVINAILNPIINEISKAFKFNLPFDMSGLYNLPEWWSTL